MAIPSQTAMVLASNGTPPALRTPSLTACEISLKCIWPGTISLKLLMIPIKGLSNSCRVHPRAYSRDRCGARSILAHSPRIMLTEHTLEKNAVLPEHKHPHEQLVYLLSGHLILEMGGNILDIVGGPEGPIAGIPVSMVEPTTANRLESKS